MISDKNFPEFASSCVRRYMKGSYSWPSSAKIHALWYLTFPSTDENMRSDMMETKLIKFYSQPRTLIRKKISGNFIRILSPLAEGAKLTLAQYARLFPGDERKIDRDQYFSFRDFTNQSDYFISYKDKIVLMDTYLELLYYELFVVSPPDIPISQESAEGRVTSFADQSEEALDNVVSMGPEGIVSGKTVQSKLIAEKYGLDKDKLFQCVAFSSVSFETYYQMDESRLRDAYANWLLTRDQSTMYLLRTLNLNTASLDPYYKESLDALVRKLDEGKWYKADDIYKEFKKSTARVMINSANINWTECVKAIFAGFVGNRENNLSDMEEELVSRPVVYGMLYILSMFGILDITEKEPELTVQKTAKKLIPYSPCDALDMISLTAFGRWVLGLTESKPEMKKTFSDPVLDSNLLLVTYKGTKVNIRSFLSSISEPLGEAMFKVTLKSFTSSTGKKEQAEELVKEFHRFFPNPPENWENFFSLVLSSYEILPQVTTGRLLEIKNEAVLENLLKNPAIRSLVILTEGNFIFVKEENVKKFSSLLEKEGYHDAIDAPLEDPAKLAVQNYKTTHLGARGRRRSYW